MNSNNKIIRKAVFSLILVLLASSSLAEQKCQPENILASTPASRFVVDNNVVLDTQTDLMWLLCVEGLSGEACEEGEVLEFNWAQALQQVDKVNGSGGKSSYQDWRLPNIRELSTLVEMQCAAPAINLDVFPNTPVAQTWTSSPYHFYTHYSWLVDFNYGAPTYDERIRGKTLRLVRDLK